MGFGERFASLIQDLDFSVFTSNRQQNHLVGGVHVAWLLPLMVFVTALSILGYATLYVVSSNSVENIVLATSLLSLIILRL